MHWLKKSGQIIDEVDAANLTPSDYTLEFYGFPKKADDDEINSWIKNLNKSLYAFYKRKDIEIDDIQGEFLHANEN